MEDGNFVGSQIQQNRVLLENRVMDCNLPLRQILQARCHSCQIMGPDKGRFFGTWKMKDDTCKPSTMAMLAWLFNALGTPQAGEKKRGEPQIWRRQRGEKSEILQFH